MAAALVCSLLEYDPLTDYANYKIAATVYFSANVIVAPAENSLYLIR